MKNPLKLAAKHVLSIIPLTAILVIFNINTSRHNNDPAHPASSTEKTTTVNAFQGLPCGFKQVGLEEPHKPSFLPSNSIPVLQYPAGNSPGTTFQIPDAIYNDSQSDQLILQADGNLVIYCTSCNPARALWSTQTNGKGGKFLFFQTDGELVLKNANNKIIWRSNIRSTCDGSDRAYFTLQEDGNLAMLYDQVVGGKQIAIYLGGSASTNNQAGRAHDAKIN